ncbi:hypothetical protein AAMO2058_000547200, partial [Amorphochlora amoebiformis]
NDFSQELIGRTYRGRVPQRVQDGFRKNVIDTPDNTLKPVSGQVSFLLHPARANPIGERNRGLERRENDCARVPNLPSPTEISILSWPQANPNPDNN